MRAAEARARLALVAVLFACAPVLHAGDDAFDDALQSATREIAAIDERLAGPPPADPAPLRQRRQAALERIEAAGRTRSGDPGAQSAVADAFLKAEEPKRALPHADRAVELRPGDPNALVSRGNIHYKLGEYRQARSDAKAALRLDGRNAAAVALLRSTEGREGASQYGNDGGGRSGGEESSEGRPKGYAGQSEAQAAADRLRAARLVREAENKERLGEHEAARAAASLAKELDPTNPRAYAALAAALDGLGRTPSEVAAVFRAGRGRAMALSAGAEAALQKLDRGEYEQAVSAARAALARDPNDAAARAIVRLYAGRIGAAGLADDQQPQGGSAGSKRGAASAGAHAPGERRAGGSAAVLAAEAQEGNEDDPPMGTIPWERGGLGILLFGGVWALYRKSQGEALKKIAWEELKLGAAAALVAAMIYAGASYGPAIAPSIFAGRPGATGVPGAGGREVLAGREAEVLREQGTTSQGSGTNRKKKRGKKIYRVWGKQIIKGKEVGSGLYGHYWTSLDPRFVRWFPGFFRLFAGLPAENSGAMLSVGYLKNETDVKRGEASPVQGPEGAWQRSIKDEMDMPLKWWPQVVVSKPLDQIDVTETYKMVPPF